MPVPDLDFQSSCREGADEDQLAGILGDVDESAGAGEPAAEAADIDVTLLVGLSKAEAGEIEAAAIIEVELLVLVDDRAWIDGRAKIQTSLRQSADDAGFGRQRQHIEKFLFRRDGRHALWHADAEIDDAAERQLEGASPGDDLAFVEGSGGMRSTGARISPEKAGL